MKNLFTYFIILLCVSSHISIAQQVDRYANGYFFHNNALPSKTVITYNDIEGSPYLYKEFSDAIIYSIDTQAVKLPLRYNIYTNEMEYQLDGNTYTIGNPSIINKIMLGEHVFVYLKFIGKGGYFELLETGKCFLVQKRAIKYNPPEAPKAVVGSTIPPKFTKETDVYYTILNDSTPVKVENMKSLLNTLSDQKTSLENFIEKEKIKNVKRENLIQIIKYYNSL
ncbi:MAG TPA: hypothetical protein PLC59_12335 [Bacteroidales bacterium]|nr:hypothetical protein [Bacteroidales bacterium]